MSVRSAAPVLAVLAVVMGLAGCGGSSRPASGGSPRSPSRTAPALPRSGANTPTTRSRIRTNFAESGASLVALRRLEDRACTKLVQHLVRLPAVLATSGLKATLDREISYLARFNATIYKLSAPRSSAGAYKHFVYANGGALYLFRRLEPYLLGARRSSAPARQLMERASLADRDAALYGRRLGLSACATGQMHHG